MNERLAMLMRVGKVRERRAERERREALAEAERREAHARAALERVQGERERRAAAETTFMAAPADPQAQLWRHLTSERLHETMRQSDSAKARAQDAQQRHCAASQTHQRTLERGKALDARQSRAAMLDHLRQEVRDEDERCGGGQ